MRALAPGKLLLTGAYAVLEGAPAVVMAVDRHAVADASRPCARPSAEVRAALGDEPAPAVDAGALHDATGRKLGLGSSAAALVASLGARALARGHDLRASDVRSRIFDEARRAHASAQSGGSGVDVAASVFGGVLRYELAPVDAPDGAGRAGNGGGAAVRPLALPVGLAVVAFDSGTSVRTTDMRARFHLRRDHLAASGLLAGLCAAARGACAALEAADAPGFVDRARAFADALAALGRAIDAPVVPPRFAELAELATREGAAFLPSGAGGGDAAVWLGMATPSAAFTSHAEARAMRTLALSLDRGGLRPQSPP